MQDIVKLDILYERTIHLAFEDFFEKLSGTMLLRRQEVAVGQQSIMHVWPVLDVHGSLVSRNHDVLYYN